MSKLNFIKNFIKNLNRNTLLVAVAVVGIIITGVLIFVSENSGKFSFSRLNFGGLSDEEVAKKAVDYINEKGLASSAVSLVSASEESGLVKIKIKIDSSEFDSYVSKDGKLLFPQVFKMDASSDSNPEEQDQNVQPTAEQTQQACDATAKTDKPVLEAYVVSNCPFGLQMQRVFADVVNNAPDLAQNMFVRYIGSIANNKITSMHGDQEAQENLRQICIRDEQRSKYWNYVSCYLKAGETESCLTSTAIDKNKLNNCVSDKNRGLAYAKEDFDLSEKYSATASPALMLGENKISESTFGGRTSEAIKLIICCASNNKPADCSKTLNTTTAAYSFSETYEGSGNNADNANCQ